MVSNSDVKQMDLIRTGNANVLVASDEQFLIQINGKFIQT